MIGWGKAMATKVIGVRSGGNTVDVVPKGNSGAAVTVVSGQNRVSVGTGSRGGTTVEAVTGLVAGVTKQYVDVNDDRVLAHSDAEDARVLAESKAYTDDRMPYLIQSYITENKDLLKGDDGEPFYVYKTYPTVNDMQLDFENIPYGKFVVISSQVGDVDNGKVYQRGLFGWEFIVAMASIEGPQGIQGPQGEKGDKGDKGDDGSDATVTTENISAALGFEPVSPEDLPTKVSDLENDAGYLTEHQSLDGYYTKPQVDSIVGTLPKQADIDAVSAAVALKADRSAVYTKNQVDTALAGKADVADIPTVPTKVSQLSNDAGYITAAYVPEVSSSSIIAALGYTPADASDIPTVPDNVSWFTNDAGYLTEHQSLANYYTKNQVDAALAEKADAADVPVLPTAVSAFQNDAGYLTQHQSLSNYYTKAQVQNQVNSAVSTASDALQDAIDDEAAARASADSSLQSAVEAEASARASADSDIQDAVALKADASAVYTKSEINSRLNTINTTLDAKAFYSDLPTAVSDLTNDAGYITLNEVPEVSSSSIIAALGYTPADAADLVSAYVYKGSVAAYANLPASGNTAGDVWNVVAAYGSYPAGTNWAWTGSAWDALGGSVDLSAYALASAIPTKVSQLSNDAGYLTQHQSLAGYVPTSRKVNNKALTADISLTAGDVSALPLAGGYMTGNIDKKISSLTKGTNPSATVWTLSNKTFDSAGTATANRLHEIRHGVDSNGFSFTDILAYDFTSGSSTANILKVGKLLNGSYRTEINNAYLRIENEKIMRNATNGWMRLTGGNTDDTGGGSLLLYGAANSNAGKARLKAYDGTNQGYMDINANANTYFSRGIDVNGDIIRRNGHINIKDTALAYNEAPTSNMHWRVRKIDKNNATMGFLQFSHYTNGQIQVHLGVNRPDTGAENVFLRGIADTSGNVWTQTITPSASDDSTKIATTAYVKDNVPKSVGASNKGVYTDANGKITAMSYEVNKDVPSNAVFTDTTYSTMGAASASAAGSAGLVPAPAAGQQGRYLRGDGTWQTPTNTSPGASGTATWATAKGTAPSSNQYHEHISYDNTGNGSEAAYRFAMVGRRLTTANEAGAYIQAYDPTSGATREAHIGVYYPAGGTAYTYAPTPSQTDDSTKIATTAYVKDCIPKSVGNANTPVYVNSNGVVTSTGKSFANYVPTSRKINGKALSSDITIGVGDVGGAVSTDNGAWAVGSYIWARANVAVNKDATTAGSTLYQVLVTDAASGGWRAINVSITGTWRNVHGVDLPKATGALYQRIS